MTMPAETSIFSPLFLLTSHVPAETRKRAGASERDAVEEAVLRSLQVGQHKTRMSGLFSAVKVGRPRSMFAVLLNVPLTHPIMNIEGVLLNVQTKEVC